MPGLLREITSRRAYRAFAEEKIPEEIVRRIMTAATLSPSCFNHQSWRFLVVTEDGALVRVHKALSEGNYWVRKAPLVVVVATKPEFDCRLSDSREYALFDCGLAVENLVLQAFKEGLYAHPIAGYDPIVVKKEFGIPEEFIVITLIAVGYPGDDSSLNKKHRELEHGPRVRKPAKEIICYNFWNFVSNGI